VGRTRPEDFYQLGLAAAALTVGTSFAFALCYGASYGLVSLTTVGPAMLVIGLGALVWKLLYRKAEALRAKLTKDSNE